jgi:benzoyl-CoA reductase subunit BamB
MISYATGQDIDEDAGMKTAKRIGVLTRAYNVRLGISRKDDKPPEKFFQEPSAPPVLPALDRTNFSNAIDAYYELKGYNREGIPTKETLEELNLDDVHRDLVQRGILPDEEDKKNRD